MNFCPLFLAAMLLTASALSSATNHATSNPFRSDSGQNSSRNNENTRSCISVADAQKHIGKKDCVQGTVVRVEEGNNGVMFLDFCADYHSCPFTVVVFRGDLHSVGDVRQLQGRTVTIEGRIEEYNERAEIVLRHPQQLGDSASRLTAIPKDYDVEREGHYSAGTFRPSKAKKSRHRTQDAPVPLEDPEVP